MARCARAIVVHVAPSAGRRNLSSSVNSFGSPLPGVLAESGWDGAWKRGVTPWDMGAPAPIIQHLLRDGKLPSAPTSQSVLVPGCGAGHDALSWAQSGRTTVGLDLSPTAIAAARRVQESEDPKCKLPLQWECTDFMTYTHKPAFGLIWDYTFCGALPPALRPTWAASCRRLLAADGVLALLLFPVGKFDGGPPFAMWPSDVTDMLEQAGFERQSLEEVPPQRSHKARAGREWLGMFIVDKARYPMINTGVHKRSLKTNQT